MGTPAERLISSQLVAIRPYRRPRWKSHKATAAAAPNGIAISGTEEFQEDNEARCEIAVNMQLKTHEVAIVNSAIFKALHLWRSPNL